NGALKLIVAGVARYVDELAAQVCEDFFFVVRTAVPKQLHEWTHIVTLGRICKQIHRDPMGTRHEIVEHGSGDWHRKTNPLLHLVITFHFAKRRRPSSVLESRPR